MTTHKENKDTSVPQDEANESEAGGRALKAEPNTSVPQDRPEADTSVPQDAN
ncbi:MAG: hypothetical protein ACJ8NS_11250 [Chthoniobacterales bacterium]|jgi:hypothetical protein